MEGVEPLVQWDMARLHDGADLDGELLAAAVAAVEALAGGAMLLPFGDRLLARCGCGDGDDLGTGHPAVGASNAVRPDDAFEVGAGRILVMEDRVFRNVCHGLAPS